MRLDNGFVKVGSAALLAAFELVIALGNGATIFAVRVPDLRAEP